MKSKSIRTFSSNEKLVEERREQIVRCAIKLFNKKGFDGTSVREIAAACRMTSANLYNYIVGKDDIIQLIMKDGNKESYAFIDRAEDALKRMRPTQALVKAIDLFFRHIDSRRAGVTFLYRGIASFNNKILSGVLTVEAEETAIFQRILDKGCKEKEFIIEDTRLVGDNIVSLGQMWAVKHGIFEKRYTLDEYIMLQIDNILRQISV